MKSKTPEKDKFLAWWAAEKKKGLLGMDITPTESAGGATKEEIYGELNRMNEAPALPIPDLF